MVFTNRNMDEKYIALQQLATNETPAAQKYRIDYKEYIDTVFYGSNDCEELVHRLAPLQTVIINKMSRQLLHLIGQSLFEILGDGMENEKKMYLLKFYNELVSNAHTTNRVETSTIFSLEEMDLFKLLDHLSVVKQPQVQMQELQLLHQLLPELDQHMATNFFPRQTQLQEALVSFTNKSFNDGVHSFLECLHTKDRTFSIETIWMKVGSERISVIGNEFHADDVRMYVDFNCTNRTVSFRHCMGQNQSVFAIVQYDNIQDIATKEFVQIEFQEISIKLKAPVIFKNISKIKGRTIRFRFSTRHLQELSKHDDDSFLDSFFANSKGCNNVKQRIDLSDKETLVTCQTVGILKSPSIPDTETDELITTSFNNDIQTVSSYQFSSERVLSRSRIEYTELSSVSITDDLDFVSFQKNIGVSCISSPEIGKLPDWLLNSLQVETGVPDSDQFYTPMQFETNTYLLQPNNTSLEFSSQLLNDADKISEKESRKCSILSEIRFKNTDYHSTRERLDALPCARSSDSVDSICTKSIQKHPSVDNVEIKKQARKWYVPDVFTDKSSDPSSDSNSEKKRNAAKTPILMTNTRAQHDALHDLRCVPIVALQNVPIQPVNKSTVTVNDNTEKPTIGTTSSFINANPKEIDRKDAEYTQVSSGNTDTLLAASTSDAKGQIIETKVKTKPVAIKIKNKKNDCSLTQSNKKGAPIAETQKVKTKPVAIKIKNKKNDCSLTQSNKKGAPIAEIQEAISGKKINQKAVPLKTRSFNHESKLMTPPNEVSESSGVTKKVSFKSCGENKSSCISKTKHRKAGAKTTKSSKKLKIKTTKTKKKERPLINDINKETDSGLTLGKKGIENEPNVIAIEIVKTTKDNGKIFFNQIDKENETKESRFVLTKNVENVPVATSDSKTSTPTLLEIKSNIFATKEVDAELFTKESQAVESTEGNNQVYSETHIEGQKQNFHKPNDNVSSIPPDFDSVPIIEIHQESKTNLNTIKRKHSSNEDKLPSDVIALNQKEFTVLEKKQKTSTHVKERTVEDIGDYDSEDSRNLSSEKRGPCANFDSGIQIDKEIIPVESPDLFDSDEIKEFPQYKITGKHQSSKATDIGKSDIIEKIKVSNPEIITSKPEKLIVQQCSPLRKQKKSTGETERNKCEKIIQLESPSKKSELRATKIRKRAKETVKAIIELNDKQIITNNQTDVTNKVSPDLTRMSKYNSNKNAPQEKSTSIEVLPSKPTTKKVEVDENDSIQIVQEQIKENNNCVSDILWDNRTGAKNSATLHGKRGKFKNANKVAARQTSEVPCLPASHETETVPAVANDMESVKMVEEQSNKDNYNLNSGHLFDTLFDDQTRVKRATRINAEQPEKRTRAHNKAKGENHRLTGARKRDIRKNINSITKAYRPRKRGFLDLDAQGFNALPVQFKEDFRSSLSDIKRIVSHLKTQLYQVHLNMN